MAMLAPRLFIAAKKSTIGANTVASDLANQAGGFTPYQHLHGGSLSIPHIPLGLTKGQCRMTIEALSREPNSRGR